VSIPHPARKELFEAHPLGRSATEQPSDQRLDIRRYGHDRGLLLVVTAFGMSRLVGKLDPVFALLNLAEELDMVVRPERRFASGHLIQHGAYRPQIGLGVVLLIPQDLGCHVEPVNGVSQHQKKR
jgi:hypothetical protein